MLKGEINGDLDLRGRENSKGMRSKCNRNLLIQVHDNNFVIDHALEDLTRFVKTGCRFVKFNFNVTVAS